MFKNRTTRFELDVKLTQKVIEGSSLPVHIKKISVPMFKNRTTRFELDVKLTQKVIDELVSRGKVEITGDVQSADAILSGEILSFTASPIAFTREGTADRYKIFQPLFCLSGGI